MFYQGFRYGLFSLCFIFTIIHWALFLLFKNLQNDPNFSCLHIFTFPPMHSSFWFRFFFFWEFSFSCRYVGYDQCWFNRTFYRFQYSIFVFLFFFALSTQYMQNTVVKPLEKYISFRFITNFIYILSIEIWINMNTNILKFGLSGFDKKCWMRENFYDIFIFHVAMNEENSLCMWIFDK